MKYEDIMTIFMRLSIISCFIVFVFSISKYIQYESNQTRSETSESNHWMQQMQEKYKKINKRIQEVCQKYRQHYGENFDKHNKTRQLLTPVKGGLYQNIMFYH